MQHPDATPLHAGSSPRSSCLSALQPSASFARRGLPVLDSGIPSPGCWPRSPQPHGPAGSCWPLCLLPPPPPLLSGSGQRVLPGRHSEPRAATGTTWSHQMTKGRKEKGNENETRRRVHRQPKLSGSRAGHGELSGVLVMLWVRTGFELFI